MTWTVVALTACHGQLHLRPVLVGDVPICIGTFWPYYPPYISGLVGVTITALNVLNVLDWACLAPR
jgi:hypothetical protein